MDKLDEEQAGDANDEGGHLVGEPIERGCCSRVQVLARGEWIPLLALQAFSRRRVQYCDCALRIHDKAPAL